MRKLITVLVIGVLLLNAGCVKQPAQTTTPDSTSPTSATISVTPVTPPSKGDWTVTKQQIVEDKTISLNGNLVLKKGSSLTLRNVKLVLNCKYDGEYRISAEPGSSLYIYDSVITAFDLEKRFSIIAEGNAFELVNSELHGSGWGNENDPEKMIKVPLDTLKQEFALWVTTDGAVIEGNVISENYGVIALVGSKIRVANNKIHTNTGLPILAFGGGEQIVGNQIEHSVPAGTWGYCIGLYSGDSNLIEGNQITAQSQGGGMLVGIIASAYFGLSFNNKILNNKISNLSSSGIVIGHGSYISSNNLVKGNVLSSLGECAMYIHGGSNKIEGNTINSCPTGIDLTYSYGNVVNNNTISEIGVRIPGSSDKDLMEPCDAIRMSHCSNNSIVNNEISDAGYSGILMWGLSSNNIVEGNRIFSSYHGIFILYSSDHNRVTGNEIVSTTSQSIMFDNSSQNLIFSNNFIDCREAPYDSGGNKWDNEQEGNYWSDYIVKDVNGDGVGDLPYSISSSTVDNFPLMRPVTIQPAEVPVLETVPNPQQNPAIHIIRSEEWKDKTVALDSDLTIQSGTVLTITNVKLLVGSETQAVMIYIESGGELRVNNSTISDTEHGYGCLFMAAKGSTFTMKDSRWQGAICMWWDEGFFNFADNTTIDNCILQRVNIKLIGTSWAMIVNNTIEDTISPISLYSSSNCVLDNNIIRNCIGTAIGLHGSYVRGSEGGSNNNSVQNNLVSNSWGYGIIVDTGSGNIVSHNQIENVASIPLLVIEDNNVVKDNIIR